MSIRRLTPLLITIAMLLAGCAGPTPAVTVAPTASNVPTAAPTATALPAATSAAAPSAVSAAAGTPASIATTVAHDLVPAGQLNPKTQARLRLGYYVADGPNVDLIVNNAIAVNGDQPQINIPANYAPGYLYLPPGTYSVAVVPTGQGIAQALLPPVDVPLAAGHRYTLAIMGLVGDKNLKPLLIDETAAELKAGALPTDSVRIWVDNMAGGTAIDVSGGGNTADTQVAYGGSTAVVYPVGNYPFVTKLIGADSAYPSYDDPSNAPGTTNMVAFVGAWGNRADAISGPPVSELSILDYLRGFSGKKVNVDGPASFDILLAAIKTAGLTDLLTTGGPYWFLAPTDAAFKALPDQQRTALLADPQALGDLIRNLLVPAYVPRGALAKTPGGAFERTLTNLLGAPLTVGDGFSVNGVSVGGNSVFLADGSQVHPIGQMLLPPSVVALAPPTPTVAATAPVTTAVSATGRIAYYSGADHSPDNNLEIYLINPDGSGKIQLTNNQFSDDLLALSPDGKRIAFVSDRHGNDEIYVMSAPATQAEAAAADKGAVRLTKNSAFDKDVQWTLSPQWSPDGKQIAFVSNHDGNAEIYVINADGTDQKRLTNNPATDTSPSWSPDGKHIAFDSDRGGNVDVYVMNVDGSSVNDLTINPANDGQPAWSPDGQQIAFVSDRTGTGSQVFVMQADGSRQTNVSNSSSNDFAVNWSPDGADLAFFRVEDNGLYIMRADGSRQTLLTKEGNSPIPTSWGRRPGTLAPPTPAATEVVTTTQAVFSGRLAFASDRDGNDDIYLMTAGDNKVINLTNTPQGEANPRWSPDGKNIAFLSNRDGNIEIYVMNADGSGQKRLTNSPGEDVDPAWSPDGKQIAFSSHRDGDGEIYVMNADGSNPRRLTNNPAWDELPDWSPDGQKIAFTSDRDGPPQIYVMNVDGSGQTNLSQGSGTDAAPRWSPDGMHIAFWSDRDGNPEVYKMNADGSNQTRLTNNPAADFWPSWSIDGTQIFFDTDRDGNNEIYLMNADGSGQTNLTNNPASDSNWPDRLRK